MFGATKRVAMLGQVPLLGQIGTGFSWNTAPGGWNPYVPAIQPQIPNTFGGLPAPGAGMSPAPAGDCYTCTNPSTGDTKYGVPSATAGQLKSGGYRCRKDECAGLTPGQIAPLSDAAQNFSRGISNMFSGGGSAPVQDVTGYAPSGGYGMLMEGARIPIQRGIGRRAFAGW